MIPKIKEFHQIGVQLHKTSVDKVIYFTVYTDCCLMPSVKFFSFLMVKRSYILLSCNGILFLYLTTFDMDFMHIELKLFWLIRVEMSQPIRCQGSHLRFFQPLWKVTTFLQNRYRNISSMSSDLVCSSSREENKKWLSQSEIRAAILDF